LNLPIVYKRCTRPYGGKLAQAVRYEIYRLHSSELWLQCISAISFLLSLDVLVMEAAAHSLEASAALLVAPYLLGSGCDLT
jgi:hypothetical protein